MSHIVFEISSRIELLNVIELIYALNVTISIAVFNINNAD